MNIRTNLTEQQVTVSQGKTILAALAYCRKNGVRKCNVKRKKVMFFFEREVGYIDNGMTTVDFQIPPYDDETLYRLANLCNVQPTPYTHWKWEVKTATA